MTIDPPVLMAPMAGFTDFSHRWMVRRFGGVGLPAVEMISARGFLEMDARGRDVPARLWGIDREPRPLAVQIWDNDPTALAQVGARLVQEFGVSVVDVNFGCPVKVICRRAKSGSYLLRDPDRVGAIIARVVAACHPIPVTAKIRLGVTRESINAIEVAQAIEAAGGAAVTVHGRTAEQMFRGTADWDQVARIKSHLHAIPLIGNGDLDSVASVVHAFEQYEVDGVMIGRASLGRPWLFAQIHAALAGKAIPPDPSAAERRDLLLEHYRLVLDQHGPKRGTMLMRKYACRHAQGLPGARNFRDQVCRVATREEFFEVVRCFFPREEAAV